MSEDGRTFIHTDALAGRIGFVDITDPAKPRGLGTLDLAADLGVGAHAEPTSVAVVGGYVLVVVDTSESFTAPSGRARGGRPGHARAGPDNRPRR